MQRSLSLWLVVAVATAMTGCGDDDDPSTVANFALDADWDTPATFYEFPWPSDLRLTADGEPDLTGFPNPKAIPILDALISVAGDRPGWPMYPVAYFQFDGPLAPRVETDVIAASTDSPILLIDLEDPGLLPTVARTLTIDDYLRNPTLGVAPHPGIVLYGHRRYAYVVLRSLGDADGALLGVPDALAALAAGNDPGGPRGAAASDLYAPLWTALDALDIAAADVAAATVFTTGDVVADLHDMTSAMMNEYSVTIPALALDPDDGADHERYCELHATLDLPQFQVGTPPFDEDGLFEIGDDGLPVLQRTELAPLVIAIPKAEMPAGGYPLMIYFHGSGGVANTVVDRGPRSAPDAEPAKGLGPAHVVAEHGIASAGAALPLSPDRLSGAAYTEYLNFNNLAAFRDTFRQGVVEQRLLLEALRTLTIDPAALAGCDGPTLPVGATAFHFDPDKLVASGQSMGGMYTNLISPVEPRIRAAVPTGAGGFWSSMILGTDVLPGTLELLAILLGTPFDELTYMHPGMQVLEMGWEAAEPLVFMPRLARRPLPGHPVRSIYEPVGLNDFFFPSYVYDAVAVSYGHQQAGEEVWQSMQATLAVANLDGIIDYPVSANLTSETGADFTGVVVQYADDGIDDGHHIYAQRDEVKYQYGCFLATFLERGVATVPAPAALGTPCP
jgi:hypothetical protein